MPWCSDTPTSLQLARERTTTSRRGGTVTGATGRTTTPSSTATPGGTAVAATGGATRCWTFTVDAAGPASDDAAPPSTATIAKVAVDAAPAIATRDAAAGCRRLLRTTGLCRSVIVVPSLVPVVIVGLAVLRAVVRPIVVVRPVVVVRIVVVRPAGLVGGRVGARHDRTGLIDVGGTVGGGQEVVDGGEPPDVRRWWWARRAHVDRDRCGRRDEGDGDRQCGDPGPTSLAVAGTCGMGTTGGRGIVGGFVHVVEGTERV